MHDEKDIRKKTNANLIERMRRGEPLNTVPPSSTWFPPRPLIVKNKKDIERLYGEITKDKPKLSVCGDDEYEVTDNKSSR